MKSSLLFLFVLFSFSSYCQGTRVVLLSTQDSIKISQLYSTLNSRVNQALCLGNDSGGGDDNFGAIYEEVFSTVVLGKSDVIANGSAFSYTQDNNKSTFSINGTYKPKNWNKLIFDGGIAIKGKDNNFTYYSKNEWSNDITIKLGISRGFGKSTLKYMPEACKLSQNKRAEFYQKKLDKLKQNIEGTTMRRDDVANLEEEEFNTKTVQEIADGWEEEFDKSTDNKDKYHGYTAIWINLNGSYTNSSFKIENDSLIDKTLQKKYRSVSKFTFDFNVNYHNKRERLFYLMQGGIKFNRMSLLDNPAYNDKKFKISQTTSGAYNMYYYNSGTQNNVIIGDYNDVRIPVLTFDFGAFGAVFFGKQQRYGLNAKTNFNVPYGANKVDFVDNYTLLFGPIIRLDSKKSFSSVTITLNGGFENQDYHNNAWKEFVFKVSAAIPFNIFEKKQS